VEELTLTLEMHLSEPHIKPSRAGSQLWTTRPHARLVGLSRQELNGVPVEVSDFDEGSQRWVARPFGVQPPFKVKECNLSNYAPVLSDRCSTCHGEFSFCSVPRCRCGAAYSASEEGVSSDGGHSVPDPASEAGESYDGDRYISKPKQTNHMI